MLAAVHAQWFGRADAPASSLRVDACSNLTLAGRDGRSLQVYTGPASQGCRVTLCLPHGIPLLLLCRNLGLYRI